ncbi:Kinesin-like protein [Phytophthora cactorum]|nr:Kinesin-like protein [Phytophthora cactorum]
MGHDVDGTTQRRAARNNPEALVSDSRSPLACIGMAASSSAPTRDKRIKVCVRLRPFTRTEKLKAGGKAAWTWHENTIYQQIFPAQIPSRVSTSDGEEKKKRSGGSTASSSSSALRDSSTLPSSYSFDYLYPPATQTQTVYNETVKDAIMAATEGYHSSVFLYGQTGTGKTYTMQGGRGDPGIIQLGVQDIFDHIARHPSMEFLLRFSYLEIYNERIHDLLAAGAKSDIKIYDVHNRAAAGSGNTRDGFVTKDVVIKGLREEIVLSTEHVLSLVEVGNLHRHMATTESNDQSSRSHVVFRMVIESQAKRSSRDRGEVTPVRSATLNIIDLAGSESVRLANTTGQALEEGKFINRSLLTLGHIIWKLSRDRYRQSPSGVRTPSTPHLPYRNSKLTRILQPSLGGQAQIAIVCTASPSVECLTETHNTLKFASRARRVRNRVVVNEGLGESALLRKYRARIRELEEQLERLQVRRRPRALAPMSNPNQTLDERQMELKFAINNINRVILNSSQGQERPDDEELASIDEDTFPAMATPPQAWETPHHQLLQSRLRVEAPQTQSRAASRPLLRREPVHSTSTVSINQPETEEEEEEGKDDARPRLVHSGSSANTSNKTLIGSGGSASTKTLPLSTSSSRHLTDNDEDLAETKEEYDGDGEDEPEHEEDAEHDTPPHQKRSMKRQFLRIRCLRLRRRAPNKYLDELSKMDQRTGRWQRTDEGELYSQKELLREFVRGLEIAQAEQETRMSKIRELELENRRLRQTVASRDDELSQLKTETTPQTHDTQSS